MESLSAFVKITCLRLKPLVTSQPARSDEFDPLRSQSARRSLFGSSTCSSSSSQHLSRDLLLDFLCHGSRDFRRLSSALLRDFFN